MLFVQMGALAECDEKLRSVSIFTTVSHGNHTSAAKLQPLMKLILEWFPIDRLSSSTSPSGISSLDHEAGNHSVKDGVVKVSFQAKLNKIAAGEGHFPRPQIDLNISIGGGNDYLRSGGGFIFW